MLLGVVLRGSLGETTTMATVLGNDLALMHDIVFGVVRNILPFRHGVKLGFTRG